MRALEELLARWEEEATVLRRRGAEGRAELMGALAEEVRDAARRSRDVWLGVEEAREWSRGYTRDHLLRLARAEEVVARRRDGSWEFLRSTLPRNPAARRTEPDRGPQPAEDLRPSERAARRALGESRGSS